MDSGIHMDFVVVTEIQDIIISFKHPGQTTEPDIDDRAIASLRDDSHFVSHLGTQRSRYAAGHRRRIPKQRMHPRDLP